MKLSETIHHESNAKNYVENLQKFLFRCDGDSYASSYDLVLNTVPDLPRNDIFATIRKEGNTWTK